MILIMLALGWAVVFGWIYLYLDPVKCKPANLITRLVDYLLKGTIIMGYVEDITAKQAEQMVLIGEVSTGLAAVGTGIGGVDVKLDQILVLIQSLQAGADATQMQAILDGATAVKNALEPLKAATETLVTSTAAILAEADSMDGQP